MDTGCPLTLYIIYFREIQSHGDKADWLQIHITQLKKTSYVIPLKCDTEYAIAMSARDEERESGMSNSWRVKTKSPTAGIIFRQVVFCTVFLNYYYFFRLRAVFSFNAYGLSMNVVLIFTEERETVLRQKGMLPYQLMFLIMTQGYFFVKAPFKD